MAFFSLLLYCQIIIGVRSKKWAGKVIEGEKSIADEPTMMARSFDERYDYKINRSSPRGVSTFAVVRVRLCYVLRRRMIEKRYAGPFIVLQRPAWNDDRKL